MGPTIIVGFPGTGKKKAKEYLDEKEINSIILDPEEYPVEDFLEKLKELIKEDKHKVIFLPTHQGVRTLLQDNGITYIAIYPAMGLKSKYLEKYKASGVSGESQALLDSNWQDLVKGMMDDAKFKQITSIELTSSEENVLEVLEELKVI